MRRPVAIAILIALSVAGAAGATSAAFIDTADTSGSSYSAKRITAAQRTDSSWLVSDAADGSAADVSDTQALDDALYFTTSLFSNTWSTTRYVEVDFMPSAPDGLTASAVDLHIDYSDNTGGGTACFWIELRRRSTGAVLGTRGSSGTPYSCEATTTVRKTTVSILPEVPNGTLANDLQIRIYGQNSTNGVGMRLHRTAVAFKRYGRTWTLNRTRRADAADGSAATTVWGPAAAGDNQQLQTGNWSSSFSTSRYVDFTFQPTVLSASAVSGAQLRLAYKSQSNGDETCWYARVYSGATLIGTHGSPTTEISCNSTSSFVTDTVALPEVDTGAEASNLRVRVFMNNDGADGSDIDLAAFDGTWHVPAGAGCVDPNPPAAPLVADAYTDQNDPGNQVGPTDTTARVQSRSGSQNRRAYFKFALPTAAEGCTLSAATLRLNSTQASGGSRTIEVFRANAAWAEGTLTWTGQPGMLGTAATTTNAAGWRPVDVLAHVQAMYAGSNDGFVLKDSAENSGTAYEQRYATREHATPSELVLTFG